MRVVGALIMSAYVDEASQPRIEPERVDTSCARRKKGWQ
jgi:hypothetical protein